MLGLGNLLTKSGVIKKFPNDFSFNFDSSNDYLDCGVTNLGLSSEVTFSFWAKNNNADLDTDEYIASKYVTSGGNNRSWLIRFKNDDEKLRIVWSSNGTNYSYTTTSSAVSNINTWRHYVITIDSGVPKVYIDGQDTTIDSVTSSGGLQTSFYDSSANVYIGRYGNDLNTNWNGLIDEFAVWDGILDANDVNKIYKKPVDFSKASTYATDRTSNLKLWLRAGDKALPEEDASIARQDFYTDFDGSNDRVVINNTGLSLDDFSVSGWFYHIDSGADFQAIISMVDNQGNDYQNGVVIHFYNDYLDAEGASLSNHLPKVSANTVGSGILQNSWNHFAYTVDRDGGSGGVKLYVNGALATTDTAVDSATTAGNIYIGSGFYGNGFQRSYKGYISNIAIHQTILDAKTISQMAKSRFTPQRNLRFSVVDFDNSNDYIDCGSSSTLKNISNSAFTASAWVNSALNGQDDIIVGNTWTDAGFHLRVSGTILRFIILSDSTNYKFSDSSTLNSGWNHVVGTWDGTNIKTFVNGVESSGVNSSGTLSGQISTRNLFIGDNPQTTRAFEGSMSSVSLYNVAKSAEEVYAIYQQGITYDESSLSGLVGYWRMGDDTSAVYPTIADSSSNSNDGTITNGASDDVVQQMVAGYDMGAFESSSEELASELVVDMDTWSMNAGTATINTSTNSVTMNQEEGSTNISFTNYFNGAGLLDSNLPNGFYKLSFNVLWDNTPTSRKIHIYEDGTNAVSTDMVLGENVRYFKITGSNVNHSLAIYSPSNNDTIVISNLSLKEVLQSEVSDTYPAIIDVTEPVLGVEIFPTSNSVYTTDGSHYTKDSATPPNLTYQDTGTGTVTISDSDLEESINISATYKLTLTISGLTSGQANFKAVSTNFGNTYVNETMLDNGTHTFYFTRPAGGGDGFKFRSDTASGSTFTISDYSLKRVFGNVGTMTNQDSADLVYSSVLPDQSFLTGVNSAYNFIDLDGSNEYIDCGDGTSLDTTSQLTLSSWVNFDSTGTNVILARDDNTNSNYILYGWSDGKIYAQIRISGVAKTVDGGSYSSNVWYHVAATFDGSSLKIYVDGDLKDTLSASGSIDNDDVSLEIGRKGNNSFYFNGKIGQTAIWNKALLATEVSAIYTLNRHGNILDSYSDNLVGYWAMGALDAKTGLNDVGDGTIYDRSGNSNHGTPTNVESTDLKSSPNAEPNGYAKGDTNRSTTTP